MTVSDYRIAGTLSSFRASPDDIIIRVLDVTGFAVKTIRRIKLKPPFGCIFVKFYFIYIAGAKSCAWTLVRVITLIYTQIGVANNKVGRLIFPVYRLGQINAGQLINI